MILIYTHNITQRFLYTCDVIFNSVLNSSFQITDDLEIYNISTLPKFAYTNKNSSFTHFLKSDGLLFENDLRHELESTKGTYLNLPLFFKTDEFSFLPYDIFATVFYFATRYEEYLANSSDKHQRFKAENSLAFRYGFLEKPYLNYLIEDFSRILKQKFNLLEFKKRTFNFLSTIDIDNAFAYAHKGITRNLGGFAKEMLSLNFKEAMLRINSNMNDKKDPYNTFDLINKMSEETTTTLQYFVLIGDYSVYDKNPSHNNRAFKNLLKSLSNRHLMGLHPSYEAYNDLEKIGVEKKRLEESIEKNITSARCHFLRIKFPETYREFIKQGITDDYTMIYPSQVGFRTGLCVPYKWFDLKKNEATQLTLHTSVIMEGTMRDYNKETAENAKYKILNLFDEVKKQGGEFISIYHNDSFVPEQKQWIEVYKTILQNSNKST